MLPGHIRLEQLDEGIRDLVINLNRIPGVSTCTTCQGHIWRHTPGWPTKDGWVYLNNPKDAAPGLFPKVREFVDSHPTFILDEPHSQLFPEMYTIHAVFESHENGNLLMRLDKKGIRNYFRRARTRLKRNLRGWDDLNNVVIEYLIEQFGRGYERLPYQDQSNEGRMRPVFGFCR